MDNNERQRKHQALKKKIQRARELGVDIHTDLIVLDYHDGQPPQLQRWNGEDWEIVRL